VTVRSWQPDQQVVGIGPGAASYLEVHENYNPGWAAGLDGRALTPVRLDGWQQGFVVPAGAGGTITMTFRPAGTYHLVLILSLLAVVVLLALAAWSFLRRPRRPRRGRAARPGAGSAESMVGPLYRFFPADGSHHWLAGRRTGSVDGVIGRRGIGVARVWLGPLAVAALIFVAGGVVALAVALLACAGCLVWPAGSAARTGGQDPAARLASETDDRDPAARLARLALAAMVASGVLSAVRPFGEGTFGPFGWPAQLCALVALAAALTPAVSVPAVKVPVRGRPDARDATTPAITAGEESR
jgi:hypothetical protein